MTKFLIKKYPEVDGSMARGNLRLRTMNLKKTHDAMA
jgi:hypothetical protein